MTFEFERKQFGHAFQSPTLVLVDPCKKHLAETAEVSRAVAAGILVRCRAVLAHARSMGIPVTYVRDRQSSMNAPGKDGGPIWIKGFEPGRYDSVFERAGPSCYGSPYFDEVVEGAGRGIVVAGFAGRGGCLSTASDAVSMGHAVTFLTDAIFDDLSACVFDNSLTASLAVFTKFEIRAMPAQRWIAASKKGLAVEAVDSGT